MADATSDRIREIEIMKRLIDINRVYPYWTVSDSSLTMYDSFLYRIGCNAIVWKRMCTLVEWTSSSVVHTVTYDLTRSLTVFHDRLYDYIRTWHPYQVFKKPYTAFMDIHLNGPGVTRIRPRLAVLKLRIIILT